MQFKTTTIEIDSLKPDAIDLPNRCRIVPNSLQYNYNLECYTFVVLYIKDTPFEKMEIRFFSSESTFDEDLLNNYTLIGFIDKQIMVVKPCNSTSTVSTWEANPC